MKVLVLANAPVSAARLRAALPRRGEGPAELDEVMVIAPALHTSALRFWVSDADEAIARAERVARESAAKLKAEGIATSADVGESDPRTAIEDALATFPADEVIVFTHADDDDDQRYREDLDRDDVRERVAVPVRFETL